MAEARGRLTGKAHGRRTPPSHQAFGLGLVTFLIGRLLTVSG
jgi:hypothetical protein